MSQPNPSTIRKMKLDSTENMDEQSDLASTCLKLFGFWQPKRIERVNYTAVTCYFRASYKTGWHPPYAQKQITILTMFQHVCFSFGLRAVARIQHFQGGLHFKHYLHTIGKFRVIPWSKIKTVRTFVSFTERFTGSFQWVPGLQKKITHITPLFQSQVLVFHLIVQELIMIPSAFFATT